MTDRTAKFVLFFWTLFFSAGLLTLADRFVKAKIANDSSIAQDTRRIAEALERRP